LAAVELKHFSKRGIGPLMSIALNPHLKKSDIWTTNAEKYFEDCPVEVYHPEKSSETFAFNLFYNISRN
jgi:hypothetical protein